MYLLLILLPLINFLTLITFGRHIGKYGAKVITLNSLLLSLFLTAIIFYEVALSLSVTIVKLFTFIKIELFCIEWVLFYDTLTVVMLVIILLISTLVHLYSFGYMDEDPHFIRFISYLSLFTFFMLILVTANNFIQMFVGWEGVGLCSYLLINFWSSRLLANKAAMKAIIVNRIGDFGLTLGILLLFYFFKNLNFSTIFALSHYYSDLIIIFYDYQFNLLNLISFLLFIGTMGKSAQIGLHVWLPDAMEGPTPVSALIHAATMVTAGIFMILRASVLFEYSPTTLNFILFIGALTAFFAATSGLLQHDIKRVIAYSTCSQLGYMVFTCGLSHYHLSLFHLMNHAFFKALLFLSAGAIIHALGDEQDMRKMGGLLKLLPFTYTMVLIGSLALMGFPFLTGFYSKDVIIEITYGKYTIDGSFAHWLSIISAVFTSIYSLRLIFLTFIIPSNGYKQIIRNAHDLSLVMGIPLIILGICTIFVGFICKDMFIGLGSNFWQFTFNLNFMNLYILESEFISVFIKLIPFIFTILVILLTIPLYLVYYNFKYRSKIKNIHLYSFFNKKWYFDKLYTNFIVNNILYFGYNISFKLIDRGILELIGPYGLVTSVSTIAKTIRKLHTGLIYHYILIIILLMGLYLINL